MASENPLPFDPNRASDLIKQGRLKVVSAPVLPPIVVEPSSRSEPRSHERARQLFGEDFLGEDAIHLMEQKCQAVGINVKFEIPQIGMDVPTLEAAKADEAQGWARMVVMHPEYMNVDGQRKPVNLLNLRDLFKKETQSGNDVNVSYDNNPFGDGAIFYEQSWYENQDFAQQPLSTGFGMPTKEVLNMSLGKTWDEQQTLIRTFERRREPVEVAWDSILYYANTGRKLLENKWDWTDRRTSGGDLVGVGISVRAGCACTTGLLGTRSTVWAFVLPGSFSLALSTWLLRTWKPAKRVGFKKIKKWLKIKWLRLIKYNKLLPVDEIINLDATPWSFLLQNVQNNFGDFLTNTPHIDEIF